MNEPFRITEEDINYFSDVLKLNEKDVFTFRSLIKGDHASKSDERIASIKDWIFKKPDYDSFKPSEVEFFSNHDNGSIRSIKTYSDIIEEMPLDEYNRINIKIRNCISDTSYFSTHAFLDALRKRIVENKFDLDITIDHIITIGKADDISKLLLLIKISHNVMFSHYSISFLEKDVDAFFDGNDTKQFNLLENTITINVDRTGNNEERTSQSQTEKMYYIFHLSNSIASRDYCMMTSERMVYDYYNSMFEFFKTQSNQMQRITSHGAAEINMSISNLSKLQKKVLFKNDPCLDSVHPTVWNEFYNSVIENNQLNQIEGFRKKIDPEGIYKYISIEDFFRNQIAFLRKRFDDNDRFGSINIFYVDSFQEFIETGEMQETKGDLPGFSVESRKKQLSYMMDVIDRQYRCENKQQFYFFNKNKVKSDLFMYVWNNEGIFLGNIDCLDMITVDFLCSDKKMSSLLYDIIIGSLSEGIILSKEESRSFLKWLFISKLNGTEQEIIEYQNFLKNSNEY